MTYIQCINFPQFFEFMMKLTHIDPGWNVKKEAKLQYHKILIDIVFKNQLANAVSFADEVPAANCPMSDATFGSVIGVLSFLLLFFIIIAFKQRKRIKKLMSKNRELRVAAQNRAQIASAPIIRPDSRPDTPVMPPVNVYANRLAVIGRATISSAVTPAETTVATGAITNRVDIPPSYDDLRPSFGRNRRRTIAGRPAITSGPVITEEDGANDESDVVSISSVDRPYPRMSFPGCPINVIEPPHVV